MMLNETENGGKQVMIVLDGVKVSTEKNGGVGPLRYALQNVVVRKDEVLVVAIFNAQAPTPSPCSNNAGYCCLRHRTSYNPSLAGDYGDTYIKFLYGEINRKTQTYMNIFRPFYDECKSNGVKFLVKIAAGYQPKAIIVDEANYAKAKCIVMDRCFADNKTDQFSGINCETTSFIMVIDAEGLVLPNFVAPNNQPEPSIVREVECKCNGSKLKANEETNICGSLPNSESEYQPVLSYDQASTSKQRDNVTSTEELQDNKTSEMMVIDNSAYLQISKATDTALGLSLEVGSWEVISEITNEFQSIIRDEQNESLEMFKGYLPAFQSEVLVKKFTGDFYGVLEAEKTVAYSMHHKNILRLIGYNQNADAISLIFPYTTKGTLERFLYGEKEQQLQLSFNDKMNIAIGIGQGLRYMHDECPQGPVIHGNLRTSSIFLQHNLTPQITGFGQAIWLQKKLSSPNLENRRWHKFHLDFESMKLVAADVLSFGILLLRLVCRKSIPQDNRMLIKWAQPLLQERAYPEMLDEEEEYTDIHGMFRLMCAAAQCIKSRHTARPSMSEVVSFLKGETSCNAQASPMLSDGSSLDMDLRNMCSIIGC